MATSPDNGFSDTVDWNLLITSGVNAILCGDRSTLDATLSTLRAHLALDLHEWWCHDSSSLPAAGAGTLIVSGLDHATVEQQRVLLKWLDAHGTVRVITLSERPLFHRVTHGALLEQLYYRLNPLYLTLSSPA